jgi:hypothetical protein
MVTLDAGRVWVDHGRWGGGPKILQRWLRYVVACGVVDGVSYGGGAKVAAAKFFGPMGLRSATAAACGGMVVAVGGICCVSYHATIEMAADLATIRSLRCQSVDA